jgi:hypothetical protein
MRRHSNIGGINRLLSFRIKVMEFASDNFRNTPPPSTNAHARIDDGAPLRRNVCMRSEMMLTALRGLLELKLVGRPGRPEARVAGTGGGAPTSFC